MESVSRGPSSGPILRGEAFVSLPRSSVRARHPRRARSYSGVRTEVYLVADIGDEEEVRGALLVASVQAALSEERQPCSHCVRLVEEDARLDRAEVLAMLIEPSDLWSIEDAVLAEDASNVARVAEARWTDQHARRLGLLIDRLAAHLPVDARFALAAVAEFRAKARVRRRVASLLLEDSVAALDLLELAA